jgi:NitT/TauT family transport system substrate-binding protein
MAGQPKPAFYVAVGVVVVALIAFAVWRSDLFAPKAPSQPTAPIDPGKLASAEAADAKSITTVEKYVIVPDQTLPPVKGVSNYQPMAENTVRFAINVWAGWAPIILANNGFKAGHAWKTPEGQDFKVELVLIDNPVQMRDAYAAGNVHIGWGTLDMVPLFMPELMKDSRTMPRIYQQVDWSNGGDGIVVREEIKEARDLRGKKIVLAGNSPSHYFALNILVASGVQPFEVQWVFTEDAFQAAAAFNAQKDIAAAVSWAPDIYNLAEKVKGNRLLVTTAQANKLIADIWFARADFARDHPGIIEGLVRGIFDAMVELKKDDQKQRLAKLMAAGYNIPATDVLNMLGDAHSTNWAENFQFFLNRNNPTNFESVWNRAYYLYRTVGSIAKDHQPVPFDQVMDFRIIEKLGKEPKYAAQVDEYRTPLPPKGVTEIRGAEKPILTNTVIIHFYPDSANLHEQVTREVEGKKIEQLYDPNVDSVLGEVGKLAGQFGAAYVVIEGHTDGSMRGQVPPAIVKELSLRRATAVKEALVQKYPQLDANRFAVEGKGWDEPANPNDPNNHAKNRRVEVRVFTAEKK